MKIESTLIQYPVSPATKYQINGNINALSNTGGNPPKIILSGLFFINLPTKKVNTADTSVTREPIVIS